METADVFVEVLLYRPAPLVATSFRSAYRHLSVCTKQRKKRLISTFCTLVAKKKGAVCRSSSVSS